MYQLRFTEGGAEKVYQLASGQTVIGRLPTSQLVIDEVELAPTDTIRLGEVTLTLEQNVPEKELLTENHEIAEGPGTIFRKVTEADRPAGQSTDNLVRLLSDVGRTLLGSQSLTDILNSVVSMAFNAVGGADRAFLLLRDSPEAELSARVLRKRDG